MKSQAFALAAFALIALVGSPSQATPVSDYLARTLKFTNCTPDQTTRLTNALTVGLERIAILNAPLLNERIHFNRKRQAEFDCSADLPVTADAQTELRAPQVLFFKAKRLKVSKLKVRKLFLNASSFPFETIVLHEFLHFLEFDNFHVRLHNDTGLIYTNQIAAYDVVYSCAVSAYPVENAFHRGGAISIYGLQSSQMESTCKAARVHGKHVSVDVADLHPWAGVKGPLECYLLKNPAPGQRVNSPIDFKRVAELCQR